MSHVPTPPDALPLCVAFIDDDEDLRLATGQSLSLAGFEVSLFADAASALDALPADYPGAIVSDVRMPGMDGLALFQALRARDPEQPVLLVTGHGDIDMAVQAMREGAFDFLTKPYPRERLVQSVRHAATQRQLTLQNRALRAAVQAQAEAGASLLGESPAMVRLRATVRQVAETSADVLIEGETGSGKEVVARLLHDWSPRVAGPWVAINCGALPDTILESELYGHEAGAFTGAQRRRVGRIAHAHGGTLFLDEIESMPLAAQVRLLRVLETRSITPLGSNDEKALDLRVVAASKVNLGDPALQAQFRPDLYYRLNVVTLRLPPLRERREDIPLLYAHFSARAAQRFGREAPDLTPALREHLLRHDWPGNVRELVHFAERQVLGLGLPQEPAAQAWPSLPARVEHYEAEQIRETLLRHRGDVRATLAELGIPRKTFYDKLQRHGIQRTDYVGV